MLTVDVVTLLAPGEVFHPRASAALAAGKQGPLEIRHHFVEGWPLPGDHRVAAIARARNQARALGESRFFMFLDRDVVLPERGIERLVLGLAVRPRHAALGLHYQEEEPSRPAAHVAMGATLFLRSVLRRITFRWEPGRCECSCCCEDLRRMGYRIDYLPGFRAIHLDAITRIQS